MKFLIVLIPLFLIGCKEECVKYKYETKVIKEYKNPCDRILTECLNRRTEYRSQHATRVKQCKDIYIHCKRDYR